MRFPVYIAAVLLVALAGCNSVQLARPLEVIALRSTGPLPPLRQVWETNVQGGFGPDSPFVAGSYLIVGTRNGEVIVMEGESGSIVGRVRLGLSVNGSVALSDDGRVLYVPLAGGGVAAYGVMSGARAWRWEGGPVTVGLATKDGVVVAAVRDGRVIGLDAATGAELWTVEHASPSANAQIQATPRLVDSDILVSDDSGTIRRIRVSDGVLVWSATVGEPVYRSPYVADGIIAVPTTRGSLVALRASDGETMWRAQVGIPGRTRVGAPMISDGTVFAGATDGGIRAFDARTGSFLWSHVDDAAINSEPLIVGDIVYLGTMGKRVLALDRGDGTLVWESDVRGRIKSGMALTGRFLVVLTEPSHVVAFEAAETAHSSF